VDCEIRQELFLCFKCFREDPDEGVIPLKFHHISPVELREYDPHPLDPEWVQEEKANYRDYLYQERTYWKVGDTLP